MSQVIVDKEKLFEILFKFCVKLVDEMDRAAPIVSPDETKYEPLPEA